MKTTYQYKMLHSFLLSIFPLTKLSLSLSLSTLFSLSHSSPYIFISFVISAVLVLIRGRRVRTKKKKPGFQKFQTVQDFHPYLKMAVTTHSLTATEKKHWWLTNRKVRTIFTPPSFYSFILIFYSSLCS
jgi:hypothetical protein